MSRTTLSSRTTIAKTVLFSFAIALVAFAITVSFSLYTQRRTVQDTVELTDGYMPLALKLGQLRATQATFKGLVQGIPDERNPAVLRSMLESLVAARNIRFVETRTALGTFQRAAHRDAMREGARTALVEIARIEERVATDRSMLERLFVAMSDTDLDRVNQILILLAGLEHDVDRDLTRVADTLEDHIKQLTRASEIREKRASIALLALLLLTLIVGAVATIRTERLLSPLKHVTDRAKDVARGDLEPHEPIDNATELGELSRGFEAMVFALGRARSLALSNERFAAIGKMAAHVTHEIRNPLSSIGLNLELLEEELAGAPVSLESKTLVFAVKREVERLVSLSEEYLRVARLPSPRLESDDIAAAISSIANFLKPELSSHRIELRTKLASPLPRVLFDESQLRQALLNLLRNAREAMPDGGTIDLSVCADGMGVIVAVDDRGTGIPEEIRGNIFDPFFSTKGTGTGLGLAIVKHIVEAHGGTIRCEAREGGGTRFRVELPIGTERKSAPTQPAHGRQPVQGGENRIRTGS